MLRENTCEFSSELVSYMYGELAGGRVEGFENHLANCALCIDEFAAVSNARYSVYEWRKEEFEPLATPEFSIPYAERPRVFVTEQKAGFWEALAGIFAVGRTPVFAAGAIVVLFALGFGAFTMLRTSNQQVAIVDAPAVIQQQGQRQEQIQPQTEQVVAPSVKDVDAKTVNAAAKTRSTRSVARPQYVVQREPAKNKITNSVRLAKKAPSLSGSAEEEDKSLRLADLFDEIGG